MTNSLRAVPGDSWRRTSSPAVEPAPSDSGQTPLLETKLYRPKWRAGSISRPALVARLARGAERKLTLISAPAGSGKTTLLAEWLADPAAGEHATAWVSLDPGDNDPILFWAYVIAALQRACPPTGEGGPPSLFPRQSPPSEAALTALINELSSVDADVRLVLDDYHVIDSPVIHAALAFLLEHLPPRMHVVIASRGDPALPLSRLRARGELTEVRPRDLRFSLAESAAFLESMALELRPEEVAELERRTEGWIAGLKLAALSLTGRTDVHGFISGFSGDHRYVADYLVEEVLQTQPERIRRFLLATSVLERLSGELCDAVTGEPDSQAMLERLERANLFLMGLDDQRHWYRYHHLFADVLRSSARREDPELFRALHRRASDWFERNESRMDAVRHAFDAEDHDRAAELLEMVLPAMDRSYESGRWLVRVKSLPEGVVRARPVLAMSYVWALLNNGELEAAEARLAELERWLEGAVGREVDGLAIEVSGEVDAERLRSLALELSSARVYLAQTLGDVPGTAEHARRALDLVPDGDHHRRAIGAALLGLACWANGELEEAYRTFGDALASMRLSGDALSAIRGTFVLGDIRVVQGRLREAASIYREGLRVAAALPDPAVAETDELYLGLSEMQREWGDLEGALQLLTTLSQSAGRGEHGGNRQRWCTAMAALHAARGDYGGAVELLDAAERLRVRDPLPRPRPIDAMKARIRIAQGRVEEAMRWATEHGLSEADELTYLREYEHVTLARVLLARFRSDAHGPSLRGALSLLERLAAAAEAGGRMGSLIEILVVRALALEAAGERLGALETLERALAVAEPEGYLRIFVDEGPPMRELLRLVAAGAGGGGYVRGVLGAFDEPGVEVAPRGGGAGEVGRHVLTPRELVILRLVAEGLRNREIAKQLFISPATVKRHVANIYAKLDARHRTEALVRAKALKLL